MATNGVGRSTNVNQLLGYGFGAVYLLVGLIGFAVSAGHGFASTHSGRLLGLFEVNGLHNLVHIAVGALLAGGAAAGPRIAKTVNATVGGVYLLVGVVGLAAIGTRANILALNQADNGLHFASAVLLLAVALSQRGASTRALPARSH